VAHAAESASTYDPADLDVHGFVSQGAFLSTGNNFLEDSKHGSTKFTEVGINFTKPISDEFRVGMQLFAHNFGQLGNYNALVDWFYASYRWKDWLGLRVGRIKLPFGLYNDVSDIDSARIPILLPQSIYSVQNRDYLLAQTGGELYGYLGLHSAGALAYRLYGGSIYLENAASTNAAVTVTKLESPYLLGGRVMWETPVNGLRLGVSAQRLRIDYGFVVGGTTAVSLKVPVTMWIASVEYSKSNWLLAAEYSRYRVKSESDSPSIFPNGTATSEQSYVMASHRFSRWIQPGLYYSLLFPNAKDRWGLEDSDRDLAATMRMDLNPYWLLKFEVHYVHGTAGLTAALNNGTGPSGLQADWGIFMVKTTAYF
jgi:hypothetical protein